MQLMVDWKGGPCASVVWSPLRCLCFVQAHTGSCKHSSEILTNETKEEKGRLVGMKGIREGKGYVSMITICNVRV